MTAVPYLTPNGFPETVKAGFFTRHGGVSQGVFASLNMSADKGDAHENVHENRRRICKTMGVEPQSLVTLNQVHSSNVVTVEKPIPLSTKGDALLTQKPGLLLGIQTADCVPILLCDTESLWVGAIHAGWRSAHLGIVENLMTRLKVEGVSADTVVAAIGPCIWQENYEVTEEFLTRFPSRFFKPAAAPQRWYFDLPGYVTSLLQEQGITKIIPSPANTFADEDRFFSNRRHVIRKEENFGGFLSAIVRVQ